MINNERNTIYLDFGLILILLKLDGNSFCFLKVLDGSRKVPTMGLIYLGGNPIKGFVSLGDKCW